MKRDMDLVRNILLAMEEHPRGFAPGMHFDGYTDKQVGYHVYIMMQAGLLQGIDVTARDSGSPQAQPISLTWQGYEFLEAAREKTRWEKAKDVAAKVGGLTFEMFKQLLGNILLGQVTKAMQ